MILFNSALNEKNKEKSLNLSCTSPMYVDQVNTKIELII